MGTHYVNVLIVVNYTCNIAVLINLIVHFGNIMTEIILLSQAEIMSLQHLLSCKNSEIENLQAQLLSSAPVSVDSAEKGISFSP